MTTIVYRDGVLAADTLSTVNGWRDTQVPVRKIGKLKDGRLYGMTGLLTEASSFVGWLNDGGERPKLSGSRVIVVETRTKLTIYEDGGQYVTELRAEPFGAWGSGMPAALGALHAGASAAEAVRIATLIDTDSGGEVWTETYD